MICRSSAKWSIVLILVVGFALGLDVRPLTAQLIEGASQRSSDPQGESDLRVATKDGGNSHRSITDRFLAGLRSPIGFSVGVIELYEPDSPVSTIVDRTGLFTMLRPRIFANTKSKRSQFQLDYSFGYRRYNRQSEVHSSEHSGMLRFDYRLSRNTLVQVSDTLRSTFNDYGVLPSSSVPVMYQPSFAQELYTPRDRSTMNSLVTSVNYRAGRKSNVTMYSSYDLWRYGVSSFGDAQGVQAGIRADYQINKWLFLDSSYSHYLNKVDPRLQRANIHRLQVGGFKFKPRRNFELYLSGGADSTRFQGVQETSASFQAGFSKTSGSALFSLVYHRGFSTAVGPLGTLDGHIVSASFTQWLSQRVNFQLNSGYTRGSSFVRNSRLEYISANAEMEIALQRHVLLSAQSWYVSQNGTNLPLETPVLSRYTISTGLQFFFASLGDRRTNAR